MTNPRGTKCLELENYSYELPPYVRFCSFPSRKLKLDYVKAEFLWYLRGDRHDLSILEKASLWKTLVNDDGGINSNYGQYIFGTAGRQPSQFDNAFNTLKADKDSRRASIMILSKDHLLSKTNDYPCTYCLNFRIRDNKLNMSVRMRSQDSIFGLGNDAPTFTFVQELMFVLLREVYPGLELGPYHHTCDSFHIYDRHFEMLEQLVVEKECIEVNCPQITTVAEVAHIRTMHSVGDRIENVSACNDRYPFATWLTDGRHYMYYNEQQTQEGSEENAH